jgi:hypothetical protein
MFLYAEQEAKVLQIVFILHLVVGIVELIGELGLLVQAIFIHTSDEYTLGLASQSIGTPSIALDLPGYLPTHLLV